MKVWRLFAAPEVGGKEPVALDDANDKINVFFNGARLTNSWFVPFRPKVRVRTTSDVLADCLAWKPEAPVVAERAKAILQPIVAECVEFLPLVAIEGVQFYVLNICSVIDCLDRDRSELRYHGYDRTKVRSVRRFAFRELPTVAAFRVPEHTDALFVSADFQAAVESNALTGFLFTDPAKDPVGLFVS